MTSNSPISPYARKLRYRDLLENLFTLEEEETNAEMLELTLEVVRESQALLSSGTIEERVQHPSEGYLDSRVVRGASDIALRSSAAVSSNINCYDKHALARHIRENPSWCAVAFPREAAAGCSLFGSFDAVRAAPTQRAQRRRVVRAPLAALTKPCTVDKLDKVEEGASMVGRVNRFIVKTFADRHQEPISFYHLVLDPESFSRSVENIYYMSYLVRDGRISIHIDESQGIPVVCSVQESSQDKNDDEENQFIVSLDMAQWKELIEAFDIKKPMMAIKRGN